MSAVSPVVQGQNGFQASQAHPSAGSQDAIARVVESNLRDGRWVCRSVKMPHYAVIDPATKQLQLRLEQTSGRGLTVVGPYLIQTYSIDGWDKRGLVVFDSSNPTKAGVSIEISGTWYGLGDDKIIVSESRDRTELRVFDLKTGQELAATKEAVCMRSSCRKPVPVFASEGSAAVPGFAYRLHGRNIGFTGTTGSSFPDGKVVLVDRCSKSGEETLRVWNPLTQESVTREIPSTHRVKFLTTCKDSVLLFLVENSVGFIGVWNPQTEEYYQFQALGLSAPVKMMTLCDNGVVSVSDKEEITIWHVPAVSANAPVISVSPDCSVFGERYRIVTIAPIGQWIIMEVGHAGLLVALDSENGQITVLRDAVCSGGIIEPSWAKYPEQQHQCVLLSDSPGKREMYLDRERIRIDPEQMKTVVEGCPTEFRIIGSRVLFAYPDGTIRHWNAQEPNAPIMQMEPSPIVETIAGQPRIIDLGYINIGPDGQFTVGQSRLVLGNTFAAVAGGAQIVFGRTDDDQNHFLIWDFTIPHDGQQLSPPTYRPHWLKKHVLAVALGGALGLLTGYVAAGIAARLKPV